MINVKGDFVLFSFTSSDDGSIILVVKKNIKKSHPRWQSGATKQFIRLTVL